MGPLPFICEGEVHCFQTGPWQHFYAMATPFPAMALFFYTQRTVFALFPLVLSSFCTGPRLHVSGPCLRSCPYWCLDHGFALFFMARVQFRPYGRRTRFLPVTRGTRFFHVSPYVEPYVPRPWFCPVFHGASPVSSVRPSDPFFSRDPWYTFFPRVAVRGSVCASTMVLPCFSWRASSFVRTAVGPVFCP